MTHAESMNVRSPGSSAETNALAASQLRDFVEALSEGVTILDGCGRLGYRNAAMTAMLRREPESQLLVDGVRRVARRGAPAAHTSRGPLVTRLVGDDLRLETSTAIYSLRAPGVSPLALKPGHVLVLATRVSRLLPTADRLRSQFRLTPREAEVALLLAEGATDLQISEAHGVSPHTTRHHAEHVFAKLGIHSRKALGLRLVE